MIGKKVSGTFSAKHPVGRYAGKGTGHLFPERTLEGNLMNPEELRYNPSHEWVGISEEAGERIAVIGITDFAIEQLTDLVYMALPTVGAQVQAGEQFGEVESVKAVSSLISPVDGQVVAVHGELVDHLEQLGEDPFGKGWIMKVKLTDETKLQQLLDYAAYKKQCAEEA